MPRNMSFALTTEQVRYKVKTVTRRLGWKNLKVGDIVQPVVKCMGLKKGEKVEKIGGPIKVVSVRREPLNAILDENDASYGWNETIKEGFQRTFYERPYEFVKFFCSTHNGCDGDTEITRIEFRYL